MAKYKTTLKDSTKSNILYPQTSADIVITTNNSNVQSELTTIKTRLDSIEQSNDYKGYFPNESSLLSTYNNGIPNPEMRQGWYARVGGEGTDDTNLYYWDVEGNQWVKGSVVNIFGVNTVNGLEPDDNGNLSLTANDIPTTFESGESVESAIVQVHDELDSLQERPNVLFQTNAQMTQALTSLVDSYKPNQVVVAVDDGDYKIGSSYKFIIGGTAEAPEYSWEEITASGGTEITDTLTLSKEVFVPEVPAVAGVTIDSVETVGTYGFEEVDGWYQNTNQYVDSSYCYSKITFTVSRDMDVIFDINQESQAWDYDYGIFSYLNTDLTQDYSNDGNNVYQSFVQHSGDFNVTYSNVTAGQYYITVKYIKDESVGGGTDTFKFKLNDSCKGQPAIPSRTYTSEQSITIGDENNLQIEGKDILSIINLKGTEENPIILNELDVGYYIISGYYKVNNASLLGKVVYQDNTDWSYKLGGQVLIQFVKKINDVAYLNSFRCEVDIAEIKICDSNYSPNLIAETITISPNANDVGKYQATLDNYVSYSTYNDEIKELKNKLTTSIENITPIKEVEEPSTADYDLYNLFGTSTDYTNKDIYYYKKTGEVQDYVPVKLDKKCDNLYIDKDITNYQSSLTSTMFIIAFFDLFDSYDNAFATISLECQTTSEGYVDYLYLNGTQIYGEGQWTTEDEKFDALAFLNSQGFVISYIKLIQLVESEYKPYILSYQTVPNLEPVQLALKEDLPVYIVDDYVTYTLYNGDYPTGIYVSNNRGGKFYYGHQGYSASSDYMITLPVGYAIILTKKGEWNISGGHGGYNFTIFDTTTKIIKGNMGVNSSRKWAIEFPPLNKSGYVPKITDADGTMEWVAPEYYTKAQTNTLLDNTVDLDSVQTITGVKTFTEQVGIANANETIDYIKHINNNFLISTSEGTNLLNIDEQLNTVDMMGEKVMRASDFVIEGTTLTINLD